MRNGGTQEFRQCFREDPSKQGILRGASPGVQNRYRDCFMQLVTTVYSMQKTLEVRQLNVPINKQLPVSRGV